MQDIIDELASIIEEEVYRFINDLKLDIDHGVELFIVSEDLNNEILRRILMKLIRSLKITYAYTYEEPGYFKKKIRWKGIEISLGIRPSPL